MKKYVSVFLAIILLLNIPVFAAADEYSGACGEAAVWNYDGGTLTIEGSGTIEKSSGWEEFAKYVFSVKIRSGITSLDDGVFSDFVKCKEIYIPDTVYDMPDGFIANPEGLRFYCYENSTAAAKCRSKGYDCHIHVFEDNWTETKAPTCTDCGEISRTCTVAGCGEIQTAATDPSHSFDYMNGEYHAPTCTEAGYTVYTCSVCGETETQPAGEALGHAIIVNGIEQPYSDGMVTKEPTCTEEGTIEWICGRCGVRMNDYVKTIPPVGHDWREEVLEYPTCTSVGKGSHYCFRCGVSEEYTIPMTDHTPSGEIFVITAPTCTEGGAEGFACAECGNTVAWDTEPYGHMPGEWITEKKPTCSANGLKVQYCERCGEQAASEEIPKTGHIIPNKYKIEKKATCTKAGLKTKTCPICGEVIEKVAIKPSGHDFPDRWFYEMDGDSCENGGIRYHVCSVCGEKTDIESVDPLGHDFSDEFTLDREPSCTKDGLKTRYCRRCGVSVESEVIPKLGHDFDKTYSDIVPATCTAGGTEGRKCSRCDKVRDIRPTEPLGHKFSDEFTVDLEPTCTTAGQMSIHCVRCGERKNEKRIKPMGHDYVTTEIIEDSTCSKEGVSREVCAVCGDVREGKVAKKDHVSTMEGIPVEPTCTEFGAVYYQCDICGEVFVTDVVPAKGHKYNSNDTQTLNATCTVNGSVSRTCTVCGYIDFEIIPAKGHSFGKWITMAESTLLEPGYRERTCTVCGRTEQENLPEITKNVLKDKETGIAVAYRADRHSGKMTLEVEDVYAGRNYYLSKKVSGLSQLWSVTLLEDGVPVEDGESYILTVPRGNIVAGLLQVYMVGRDGMPHVADYFAEYDEIVLETDIHGCVALASSKTPDVPDETVRGDLDGDGSIRANDARIALRICADLQNPTKIQLAAGDLDGDGTIRAAEARTILRAAAGMGKIK